MAATKATKEAIWLQGLLKDVVSKAVKSGPVTVYCNSQGVIALAKNLTHHGQSKHIDLQQYFVCKKVKEQCIALSYIATDKMPADGLTKPLGTTKFGSFLALLRMESNGETGNTHPRP
jgi:hypothetical protein